MSEISKDSLVSLVNFLEEKATTEVTADHLWYAIRGSLQPSNLINNLSEALRTTPQTVGDLMNQCGFGDVVTQARLLGEARSSDDKPKEPYRLTRSKPKSPFGDLFSAEFSPPIEEEVGVPEGLGTTFSDLAKSICAGMAGDAFAKLYREDVLEYHDDFVQGDGAQIEEYIRKEFGDDGLRYVVNSGIGANEQFNHYVAQIHNLSSAKRCDWIIANSPRQLAKLPFDATVENTLFMEFSRSGKTEETVKIHEYTDRAARRAVFANAGPLRDIGKRDNNLVLGLPDQVSGRFGRNTTPILLAPMRACGMETRPFWKTIEEAIQAFDLTDPDSLPMLIARYLFLHQRLRGTNHIYLACNNNFFLPLADEFTQFWNEGVNKDENDLMMSRYLGLPRDSHMTCEGILGNCGTKMAFFLCSDDKPRDLGCPMIHEAIDPIDADHRGLRLGDEEILLTEANYQRFAEVMPCVRINVLGKPNLRHAAVLSQLWADITFCYSRLKNIDPGSNPEVKFVRDRSARLLAEGAAARR